MNLNGKKVTLHDMSLRDGMHAKRHKSAWTKWSASPRRWTKRACR